MNFYIVKNSSIPEFIKLVESDSDDEFDDAVRPATSKIISDPDFSHLIEGYTGILDDHDIEFENDEHADTLSEATDGACGWMSFPGNIASKLADEIARVKISADDAENYFESAEEFHADLKKLHQSFVQALQKVGPDETGFLRVDI